jgi:hypothetical protein
MQSPTSPGFGFGFPEEIAPAEPAVVVGPAPIEDDIGQRRIHALNRVLIAINLVSSVTTLGYIVLTSTMLNLASAVFEDSMDLLHMDEPVFVTAAMDFIFNAIPFLTASLTLGWIFTPRTMIILAGSTIAAFFAAPALFSNQSDVTHALNMSLMVVCFVLACIKTGQTFTPWIPIGFMDAAFVVAFFTAILQPKKHVAAEAKEPVNSEPKELVAAGKHNEASVTSEKASDDNNTNDGKVVIVEAVPLHKRKKQVATEIAPLVETRTVEVTVVEAPAVEASAVEASAIEATVVDALSTDASSTAALTAETRAVEALTDDSPASETETVEALTDDNPTSKTVVVEASTDDSPATETKKTYPASMLVPPHMRKRSSVAVAVVTAVNAQDALRRAAFVPPHLRKKPVASGVAPAYQTKSAGVVNASAPGTTAQYKPTAKMFVPTQARNKTPTAAPKRSPRNDTRRPPPRPFHKKQATGPTPKPDRRERAVLSGWGDMQSYIKQDDIKVAAANAAKAEAMKDKAPGVWTVQYAERSTKAA